MSLEEIQLGAAQGDGRGDPLRDAFAKTNRNFAALQTTTVALGETLTELGVPPEGTIAAAIDAARDDAIDGDVATLAAAVDHADAGLALKAPKASPTFTGTATAPKITLTAAGSTGDVSLMTLQREAAAYALALKVKAGEFISVAEYAEPDNSITATKLAALCARAKAEGKSIYVPGGVWTTTGTLDLDHSADTAFSSTSPRTNVIGQGSGTTFWFYNGTGTAIRFKGGTAGSGQEAHQAISGLTLVGTNATNSIGLALDHVAWFNPLDLHITGFDKGLDGIDVEYLRAVQCVVRFNKRGVTITSRANQSGVTPDGTSSDPNSHTWIGCTIGNNSEYGLFYTRPNSLSFVGGCIQYNGLGAPDANNPAGARPGFGVKVVNPGTQGGVALMLLGGYVEGNAGVADVWVRHDNPAFTNSQSVIFIAGTGFARTTNVTAQRTTRFIAFDFAAGTGPFAIKVAAAFKNFNGATGSTPAIGFIGAQGKGDVELDVTGSVFTAGEEVDEWVDYTPSVTRPSATSGFAATASARYSRRGKTVHVQGRVSVSTIGTGGSGTISVALPFTMRAGLEATASVVDFASGTVVFSGAQPSTDYLVMNIPFADGRLLIFSFEYAI